VAVAWGMLAAGRIARQVARSAAAAEGVEVVAVASRDRGRAEELAREAGIDRVHGSYDELLADPEVECVYVSVPNSLHVDWTVRALEAGKHVLCEKPFGRRAAEVERAVAAAARCERLVMEGFMFRHLPQTELLGRLVGEGALGRLRLVRSALWIPGHAEHVGLHPELDGGALMVVGCYSVSMLRLLAGEPESVQGHQTLGPTGVDLVFSGTMHFRDGVAGQLHAVLGGGRHAGLELVGDEGSLLVPDPWVGGGGAIELRRDGEVERIEQAAADPYALELENFSRAVRGRAEPLVPAGDAVAQARAIEALYRSADEGGALEPVRPA
jgi:D-xylose 1-dehydrogenase (NADP+, D-xylono-1,5-lactone-forming)